MTTSTLATDLRPYKAASNLNERLLQANKKQKRHYEGLSRLHLTTDKTKLNLIF
jgi:hypothetical protein